MIRKTNILIVDMKIILMVCLEDQTTYSISLNQILTRARPKLYSILQRLREVKKLKKKILKLEDLGSRIIKKDAISIT